jgi:hypothetical protein
MEQWIVTYAKITLDKENGIELLGVFFGGVANNPDDADNIAKECVNTVRGGTVIPKIIKTSNNCIIEALYQAEEKFEDMTGKMRDANVIITKSQRKR